MEVMDSNGLPLAPVIPTPDWLGSSPRGCQACKKQKQVPTAPELTSFTNAHAMTNADPGRQWRPGCPVH